MARFSGPSQNDIDETVQTAIDGLIDFAPEALNTLDELAQALDDDADFAGTVTTSLAGKADATDLTDHENATTSVHGIADASLLATTAYVDTAESDAVTTANNYSDSLAINYDPAGSADTAESNANSYTDTQLSTHNSDSTNVHGIADTSTLVTGDGITDIVALTQAEYDALTPVATTLYVITD